MKITPSNYEVVETDRPLFHDLPMAYIDSGNTVRKTRMKIDSNIPVSYSKREVLPFDEFSSDNVFLFNLDGQRVEVNLRRNGQKYQYVPERAVDFTPQQFTCSAVIKRHQVYSSARVYNIKASVIDSDGSMTDAMIAVFGDAPKRNLCPSNIWINEGSGNVESLADGTMSEHDILFIESDDGLKMPDDTDIDFDALMDAHCVVWLGVNSFGNMMEARATTTATLSTSMLYSDTAHTTNHAHKFIKDSTHDSFDTDWKYDWIFSDDQLAFVMEKKDKGMIIVTHKSFLMGVSNHVKLFYEIMLQTLMSGYAVSDVAVSWITDELVNYVAGQRGRVNIRHNAININSMLSSQGIPVTGGYDTVTFQVSPTTVSVVEVSSTGDMTFEKGTGASVDPVRSTDQSSCLAPGNRVILYPTGVIHTVETGLKFEYGIDNVNGAWITLLPCQSSSLELNIDRSLQWFLPDMYDSWQVTLQDGVIELSKTSEDSGTATLLSTVWTEQSGEPRCADIRITGGGLPEREADDYRLLDIGHINGRPLRRGGAITIHLPERIEPYHKEILASLEPHLPAGTVCHIVYE